MTDQPVDRVARPPCRLDSPGRGPRGRFAPGRRAALAAALLLALPAAAAGQPGPREDQPAGGVEEGSFAAGRLSGGPLRRAVTEDPVVRAVEIRDAADGTTVALHADDPFGPGSVVRGRDALLVAFPRANLAAVAGVTEIGTAEVRRVAVFAEPGGGGVLEIELSEAVRCDLGREGSGVEILCRVAAPAPTPEGLPSDEPVAADPPPGAGLLPEPGDGAPPEAENPPPAAPGDAGDPAGREDPVPEGAAPPGAQADPPEFPEEARATSISLDFRDADLRDVLRVLGEVSGLDFVLQPGVSGRVSLRLTETPWDQALDVILRSQGLGHVLERGVLRVGALAELLAETQDRQRHREQVALAGDLVPFARRLDYVRPEEIREFLEPRLSPRGSLIADARTGTLLVRDVALRIDEIGMVLDALDIPVPGVEIEARIVLATRTLAERLGVRWGVRRDPTGADAGDGTDETPERAGAFGVDLPQSGAAAAVLDLAVGGIGGVARLDIELAAAERRGEVRILSAPRIVAQNARPATIKQGVTFPVQVVANNTVTVQFQDAVLELTVTPHVSPAGTVLLEIRVSNDSLDFGQAVNGIPSIVTQNATTRARVDDGATAVLGGVFAARESEEEGSVPFLARIPLFGRLFRSRETTRRDEELLIFLTPRIRATHPTYATDLEELPSLLAPGDSAVAPPPTGAPTGSR